MKPEEMMLGDWISFNGEPVKVQQVVSGINELDYEPIPLTAEILEKNGFVESGMFYRLALDYYGVFISEITESIWRFQFYNHECPALDSTICIGYVHELQHALKLCGIDKQITI